ncbi:5-formyltetrahydrofolate cyclo-ligase [Candidatus Pelagibacter bacterium]|nr:5-formyltetrahydrofolate cyclo-ligase [Candidatus Pelagibacter bacterium]MDA9619188.1 5-formyltetrahydrofolate cyclo-ligase [Candidatus Pelagibacter bacterium]
MYQKKILRKRYFDLRKKKYYEIDKEFFSPLINFIKLNFKKGNLKLALYYPSGFEINILKLLENKYMINKNILLPVIEENNRMSFFSWKKNNVLLVNKYGILEPIKNKFKIPNLILVPILAFDRNKYRLGYGKGFYDRYLNKYLKKPSNILTVGVAFSFQKYHKLPIEKNDVKLDYILTEKGIY